MNNIVITTQEELKNALRAVIIDLEREKKAQLPEKVFTINKVAKQLGRAHQTIKSAVKNGTIRTTKDGLIPESAIEEYLNKPAKP